MSSYTITIAPDDGSTATTVFEIDVRDATPKLMKVSLVAAEGQVLSTKALSAVDAEWLLSAVLPQPAAAHVEEAAVSVVADGAVTRRTRDGKAARTKLRLHTSPGSTPPAKDAQDPKSPAAKSTRGRKNRAATGRSTERVYRMMPDDFVSAFGQTTMADLAQTYAVPLYTVQSWVNTARKQGKIPPARKRNVRSSENAL